MQSGANNGGQIYVIYHTTQHSHVSMILNWLSIEHDPHLRWPFSPIHKFAPAFSFVIMSFKRNIHQGKDLFIAIQRSWTFGQHHAVIKHQYHYNDIIMGAIASQITSLTIIYSTVYSGADQRKHQISSPLAFVRRIHRGHVNSPHKWPVTRKMFPFDDVITRCRFSCLWRVSGGNNDFLYYLTHGLQPVSFVCQLDARVCLILQNMSDLINHKELTPRTHSLRGTLLWLWSRFSLSNIP